MFFFQNYYYFIILGLQAICVIHCLRRGTTQRWIWLIIFLPLVGCLIYIFTEMFTGRELQNVQQGLGAVLNPGGSIKRLEDNLRFADTFTNRVALADAYLQAGHTDKAIHLYESSLTGAFEENEHVLSKLIQAYFIKERYADVIPVFRKVYKLPQFIRSRNHMLYAISLEHTGNAAEAEQEFLKMTARYSFFESRYHYGLFLLRAGRDTDAYQLFNAILEEEPHLSSREKRGNRTWFVKTREELRKSTTKQSA